jgi:hypothetical protein
VPPLAETAPEPARPAPAEPEPPAEPPHVARDAEKVEHVRAMLAKVAAARGLPIKRNVVSRVLGRDAILERIERHVESDVPLEVVSMEGEMLAALELVPENYDLVAGIFRLVGAQIAGFYEPSDQTMYLVEDQTDAELDETLAHELDHALQDQSFPLAPLLKYSPTASDRLGAVHCLVEGDAVSAMLDVEYGSAFRLPESTIRRVFALSTALTEVGATTPHVLQEELVSPYTDGFAFVQGLRRRGGWGAVDVAWRRPPETTEQLLHLDKYDAREAPIAIPVPSLEALGPDFRASLDDVMGEQGLKLVFGEWASGTAAAQAAAGWGGDRYVVAQRGTASRRELATAWHLRMDSERDAKEVASLLGAHFGTACHMRKGLGAFVWKRKGRDVSVVSGPYAREGGKLAGPAGTCAVASKWADAILAK